MKMTYIEAVNAISDMSDRDNTLVLHYLIGAMRHSPVTQATFIRAVQRQIENPAVMADPIADAMEQNG